IWDAKDNDELRKKRKNPDILAPGDEVAIPDKKKGEVGVGAGKAANLTLDKATTHLHLKVCDDHGMKCTAERYVLMVAGVEDPYEDKLTEKGEIDVEIPVMAKRAELQVFAKGVEEPVQHFELHLGHMDPVETLAGVRARLEALGYPCGDEEGDLGPLTTA